MVKKIALLFILSVFICFDSTSQSLKIVDVETSEFPLIQILIESDGKTKINFNDLKISEDEEELNYSIDSSISIAPQNLICLLIDKNISITNFKLNKALNQILSRKNYKPYNDLYNIVLSISSDESASCILPISFEFSQDPRGLLGHYRNSHSIINSNKEIKDLSCSIDSLLEFINKKSIKITNKFLFVFKAENTSCTEINILKAKAEANLVNLHLFELHNEQDSTSVKTAPDVSTIIDSIINGSKRNLNTSNSYLLSYYTSQFDSNNEFMINYKGVNISGSFSNPQNEFLSSSFWISIIVFLILLFIIFYIYSRNRFRKSLIIDKKPKEKKKLVKVKKETEGTSITPSLTIEYDKNSEVFELKKIRTNIGRHSDNDILIPHLTISNHHAIITNEGGVFYIQDNQSTNGVFVNDIKISKSKLSSGDNIRMGIAKLLLEY